MSITGPNYMHSKKLRFAFQTFTETPANTPSTLGFGMTHQPHEGGDGAKCGAKFAATPHDIYLEVTQPWASRRRLQGHAACQSPSRWFEDRQ